MASWCIFTNPYWHFLRKFPGQSATDAIYRKAMLLTTLPFLRCPALTAEASLCSGELKLLSVKKRKAGEVLFGTLACTSCEATFPILAGVAILVSDVEQYLQFHAKGVASLVKDAEIPLEYREAFLAAKAEIESGHLEEDLESQRINALYFMNHFLSASRSKAAPWWRPKTGAFSAEIDDLVRKHWDHGPFARIAEISKPLNSQRVVELGCGVGGLARVFPTADSYLGVDGSFAGIALARHVYLGTPYSLSLEIPQDLFNGPFSGKVKAPRPPKGRAEIDFVVGEFQALPLVKEQFDLCLVLNAIDMMSDPTELPLLQAGLLKKGGIAIQSCPYIWQPQVAAKLRKLLPRKITSSSAAVEFLYEKAGLRIFKKFEHIPWLFLKHFRQVEMYSVHLFAARKSAR